MILCFRWVLYCFFHAALSRSKMEDTTIQISSVIHLGLGYKIPFFESQDPSPQLDMQCHHYALSDFDGGEEKVKQTFLHAGELVARQTTAFGHQFRFETTWSTVGPWLSMAAVVQILKIKGAADLIMFEIENHQFGVRFFEATNVLFVTGIFPRPFASMPFRWASVVLTLGATSH